MEPTVAVLIMLAVSAQFALQAPVNARLAIDTGKVPAALVSFLVGACALAVLVVVSGGLNRLTGLGDASPYEFTGGLIGAAFVLTALVTVPLIGAGGVAAATITGQMTGSIALDAGGALGLDTQPLTAARVIGAALLLAGTLLIIRRASSADRSGAGATAVAGRRLAGVAIVAGGLLLAAQAPINAGLGDAVGELEAAFINFVVGSLVLGVAVVVGRSGAGLSAVPVVPRRYLLGGLIGAVYVTAAVVLVRTIGAGGIAAATITGQLAASVALDRTGALGLERRPLTPVRLAAVGLLAVGTSLIVA
jgi:transporter family-2 protein